MASEPDTPVLKEPTGLSCQATKTQNVDVLFAYLMHRMYGYPLKLRPQVNASAGEVAHTLFKTSASASAS
eukprot:5793902-Amphidinium_carterae.2